jgi:tetratricopeptide (TPR) repeat protein
VERQPNYKLGEVMQRARCSNTGLASRVQSVAREHGKDLKCTHVDVRRWLDGVTPRPATAQYIAAALSRKAGVRITVGDIGMGGAVAPEALESSLDYPAEGIVAGQRLLGLTRRELAEDVAALGAAVVPNAWSAPVLTWLLSRPEPIRVRNAGRINVGDGDVHAVRATAQVFMSMDFQFGGGHARAALAQYFANDVCPLLDGRFTEGTGRKLFSAAAEVAQLLGWTAYDIGRHGLAQRYLIQALKLAQEADDRMMGGRLLSNMSHQAMFLAMEARAHAGNRDDAACSRAFSEAERFFDKGEPADDPAWISYFDAAELAGEGAHCFRDLRSPKLTREFVTRAIDLTDPVYARTLAFVRLVLAASHVQQREPGQAIAVAREAIELAGSLKSQRYLRYVTDLIADLVPYDAEPDVREFKEYVADKYTNLGIS